MRRRYRRGRRRAAPSFPASLLRLPPCPLHAVAWAPDCFATFNWSDGKLLHREPYQETFRRYGAPYLTAHRADLHEQFEDNRRAPPPSPRDRTWIFRHDVTAEAVS